MESCGIFGPKLSGKSTLAKTLSHSYWTRYKMRSLVYDIHQENWGPHAWVTSEDEKFWQAVWNSKGSLIIVDEASTTIKRNKDLIPVFTRLRHLQHKLIVIGHTGTDLLPEMRQNFDVVYLFRQPRSACKIWADTMTHDGLLEAYQLNQHEFLYYRLYGPPPAKKKTTPIKFD